jgi:heptosyltransferase I
MRVILCGGQPRAERKMAAAIAHHANVPLIDQVGKDTLPQLLALLARATVLLTPDSGPAHMATMVDTPVIGLYAATNPARSGPYRSIRWCVDAYDAASAQVSRQTGLGAAVDAEDRAARRHGAHRGSRRLREARRAVSLATLRPHP